MNDVVTALGSAGFHQFSRAVRKSGFSEVLDCGGPYTIFAPTDAAFEKFSRTSLNHLINGDAALLRAVVGYHFAAGRVLSKRFTGKRIRAVTYGGQALLIEDKNGLRINKAALTNPDIISGASVIHGIDGVLWPREAAA